MDRNDVIRPAIDVFLASLSARRAWIEMLKIGLMLVVSLSLSARRAWIEISKIVSSFELKEGRSPQGERG